MATAAAISVELDSQSRWETLWIPPLREREAFKSTARKCMREKKISKEQMIIFTCFVDYGTVTRKLLEPSTGDYDWNRGLEANMAELCEIACGDLQISPQRVIKAANQFVALGLLQGLKQQNDA